MSAQSPRPTDSDGDGVTRRGLLERTAIASGAVVTLGAGGSAVAPRYSPIGRAQAIAPVIAVGAVALGTGAVSGYTVAKWTEPDTKDVDTNDVLEDQIYEAAMSVRAGREDIVSQMQHEFLDPEDPQNTPYGRAAWQEIRAAVARAVVNGESESTASSNAVDALREQTTRSIVNVTERLNTGLNALVQQMVIDVDESVGTLKLNGESLQSHDVGSDDWITPVDASAANDSHILWEVPISTPTDAADLEGRDESLTSFAMTTLSGGGSDNVLLPHIGTSWFEDSFGVPEQSSHPLEATHSDLSDEMVIDFEMWHEVFTVIDDAYSGIQDDINDYVSSLYSALGQGAIDPSDIIGPSDIAEEFANSSDQSRLSAELVAIGAQAPADSTYRATISHPDLSADELECVFFPQFVDGADPSLSPDMTLSSDDYRMAYVGYDNAVTEEFETQTLSGDEDLEIHDLEGVDGQEQVDETKIGAEAGTDGRVVLWTGDDPPEPIANPDEHEGWKVAVTGADTDYSAPVSDVTEDGEEWVLETTDLASEETIESVEIVPAVTYERSHDYVSDPTTVDSEQTIAQMENLRSQVDDLKEALDEEDGGGDVSIPGVDGFMEDYGTAGAIGGAVGVVALFIALREFAKSMFP